MAMRRLTIQLDGLTADVIPTLHAAISDLAPHAQISDDRLTTTFLGDPAALLEKLTTSSINPSIISSIPRTTLHIAGMTCMKCVNKAKGSLHRHNALDVDVSLETGLAHFFFDGDVDELLPAVAEDTGKCVSRVPTTVLRVPGMTCLGCVRRVTQAAEACGAWDVDVSLANGIAIMGFVGDAEALVTAIFETANKVATVVPEVVVRVVGMSCSGCTGAAHRAAESVGALAVEVSLASGLARMAYDGDVDVLLDAVRKGVRKEAFLFEAPTAGDEQSEEDGRSFGEIDGKKEVTLRVSGMTCKNCVAAVTKALQGVEGTENVVVDLSTELATLSYNGDIGVLIRAVAEGARKEASLVESGGSPLNDATPENATTESGIVQTTRPVTLRVKGMTCMRCVGKVTKALEGIEGTENVSVDLDSGLATLLYNGDESVLIRAISANAGKEALPMELEEQTEAEPTSRGVTLRVQGMTSMKCVNKITKALSELHTAEDVNVSLDTGLATLSFAEADDQLIKAVENAGKIASIVAADHESMVELSLGSPTKSDHHELIEFGTAGDATGPTTTQLRVEGMTCASCVGVVEKVLKKFPGVTAARVNLLAGRATVEHDALQTSAEELSGAVSSSGYQSLVLDSTNPQDKAAKSNRSSRTFRIDFPTDIQADNALKTLRYLEGVKSVTASYSTVTITISMGVSKSTILRALEVDGTFGKMFLRQSEEEERAEIQRGENEGPTDVIDKEAKLWRDRLLLALLFFVPIAFTSLTSFYLSTPSMSTNAWLHFLFATPVQFICGAGFYRASYYALRKGRATMDCLIALSTSIAYFSSVVVVVFGLGNGDMSLGHAAMFRTSAMILVMVLGGKWIEARSKKKAAQGVAEMSQLTPDEAVLFDEKEQVSCFTVVPVKLIDVGDVVKVIAGDKIPVDGDVIDGVSAVDESMMTGESSAMPKSKGDHVIGGTVNGSGSMLVRATAVGSDAVLSQIVKLVNDAQTSRAPVEAFADSVSAVFVPVVVAISFFVFVVWFGLASFELIPAEWYADEGKFFFSLLFALETMVIACPCALGLATPTAVMVASSVGSRMGVLFRGGGAAIEAANRVETVLFDKTGTLTRGKPTVVAMIVGERGSSTTEQAQVILSDLIYLVESESHHPLAAAITKHIETEIRKDLNALKDRNLPAYKISSMEEVPGRGIVASINKGEYTLRIGSTPFVFDKLPREDVLTPTELRAIDRMERDDGLTLVSATVNNELTCVFGLEDTIREEAEQVIQTLHSMGLNTGLITGDSHESGRAVASKVGIPSHNVHAQALPWTKVSVVESKQPAAFIGDGINDAPALAGASVGIAIGAGAPVAAESAAVVLVGPQLEGVVHALDLAKQTFRRVRLNFLWAIGYNVLGIPLAAGVLYPVFGIRVPPFIASGAMALSSTCVVLSSLGLYLYKPRFEGRGVGAARREMRDLRRESDRESDDVVEVPLLSAQV